MAITISRPGASVTVPTLDDLYRAALVDVATARAALDAAEGPYVDVAIYAMQVAEQRKQIVARALYGDKVDFVVPWLRHTQEETP